MTKSRVYYDAALRAIADGRWIPNAAAGFIISAKTGRALSPQVSRTGYYSVGVRSPIDGRSHPILLHRVIWESVHGPIEPLLQVNHIDGVKAHNQLSNLELMTAQQNMRHAHLAGLFDAKPRGEQRWNAKVDAATVQAIRSRVARGETQTSVAASVGLSQGVISGIVNGTRWRYVG